MDMINRITPLLLSLSFAKDWLTTNAIIIVVFFFCSCEDTVTDNTNISDGFDPEDWVELHNPTNETIAIGLWEFKDENDDHVFTIQEDQILGPGQYLVLCKNIVAFNDHFPDIGNFAGDLGFGLSGGGELIRLFDSNGLLVDKVEYNNSSPWPTEPDGNGPTLELIHPSLDNDLGENWAASDGYGTPGAVNSVYVADSSNSIDSAVVINEINYNSADE